MLATMDASPPILSDMQAQTIIEARVLICGPISIGMKDLSYLAGMKKGCF